MRNVFSLVVVYKMIFMMTWGMWWYTAMVKYIHGKSIIDIQKDA